MRKSAILAQQAQPIIERCDSERLYEVLAFLDACDLPIDDLSLESQSIFAARDGDQLIGCCAFELHGLIAQLRSFAIRPGKRSFALARTLICHLIREAIRSGAGTLIPLTETLPEQVLHRLHFEKCDRKGFDI